VEHSKWRKSIKDIEQCHREIGSEGTIVYFFLVPAELGSLE